MKAKTKATPKSESKRKTTPRAKAPVESISKGAEIKEGTTMAQEKTPPQTADPLEQEAVGLGNLAQIRDILFGAQIRDYEKRFTRLEERATQDMANLKEDTRNRLESLERYIKKEVESLSSRVKTEQADRTSDLKDLSRELKDLSSELEKKISILGGDPKQLELKL